MYSDISYLQQLVNGSTECCVTGICEKSLWRARKYCKFAFLLFLYSTWLQPHAYSCLTPIMVFSITALPYTMLLESPTGDIQGLCCAIIAIIVSLVENVREHTSMKKSNRPHALEFIRKETDIFIIFTSTQTFTYRQLIIQRQMEMSMLRWLYAKNGNDSINRCWH